MTGQIATLRPIQSRTIKLAKKICLMDPSEVAFCLELLGLIRIRINWIILDCNQWRRGEARLIVNCEESVRYSTIQGSLRACKSLRALAELRGSTVGPQ